jgi:hypothetical protein
MKTSLPAVVMGPPRLIERDDSGEAIDTPHHLCAGKLAEGRTVVEGAPPPRGQIIHAERLHDEGLAAGDTGSNPLSTRSGRARDYVGIQVKVCMRSRYLGQGLVSQL